MILEANEGQEVVKQWALSQLFYRQPKGKEAQDELCELIGDGGALALATITGMLMGGDGKISKAKLKELARDD